VPVFRLDDDRCLPVRLRLPGAVVPEGADRVLARDAPLFIGLVRFVVFVVGQERAAGVLRVALARDAERGVAGPDARNVRVAPGVLGWTNPRAGLRSSAATWSGVVGVGD
jgi:hypothetical protein